jgi:hypothetical protein
VQILWDQLFVNPAYNRTMYMIPRTVFEPCCEPSLEKPIIHLPGVHPLVRRDMPPLYSLLIRFTGGRCLKAFMAGVGLCKPHHDC